MEGEGQLQSKHLFDPISAGLSGGAIVLLRVLLLPFLLTRWSVAISMMTRQ
eukprot:SAG31_NODE_2384_length_5820_cov_7.105732_2_plen_51_part_00